ncbi:hypothetical protein M9H77_18832 [Catharanthus roseus]|uniref:Uncharacterized protein n=1 Tax=Catharanthus roseus TaxID=4058 RepID=A0ACC0B8L3_CATRO|nr:hypothetical protein M9H77_18832 [Catharanthus roseus]
MRVSSAAGKFEQIKTHQRCFYAPNSKEHVMQQWGSTDKVRIPKTRPSEPSSGYRLLGHLLGLLWGQPQFRAPPDSPLGDRPTSNAMSTLVFCHHCLSVGEFREIAVRKKKRERNRGRSVAGDSFRLRLLTEGYNPDHHPSLSSSPRCGGFLHQLVSELRFSALWFQRTAAIIESKNFFVALFCPLFFKNQNPSLAWIQEIPSIYGLEVFRCLFQRFSFFCLFLSFLFVPVSSAILFVTALIWFFCAVCATLFCNQNQT